MGHSASWAVRYFLKKNNGDVSESLLFGFGRTAWYSFQDGTDGPVLLTYHPQRVARMFLALNLPAETYHCWTAQAPSPKLLEEFTGGYLLTEIDRSLIEPGAQGGLVGCSESHLRGPRTFCVWPTLTSNLLASGWPEIDLAGPQSEMPIVIDGSLLTKALCWDNGSAADYTFYLPYTAKYSWNKTTVRVAVHQWLNQMRRSTSYLGLSGIEALNVFANTLENGGRIDWSRTRLYAKLDAGLSGHRDLLADFFLEAADVLDESVLIDAAGMCHQQASLWKEILDSVSNTTPDLCAGLARQIYHSETKMLQLLESWIIL